MDKETLLKKLGLKTMFRISDEEMPLLIQEYDIFMNHVQALESIDTTGVEPMTFPYDIETTFLREDEPTHMISREEALKNAKDVTHHQIRVPKVVG